MVPREQSSAGEAVSALPVGPRSEALLKEGRHALFGVSVGNSYFSRRRLAVALAWAARGFAEVDVVYADLHLQAMLEASGYSAQEARRSTVKQLQGIRRRLRGALGDIGDSAGRIRVRALSEFLEEPAYREVREETRRTLRTDVEMRTARDAMAYAFLARRLHVDSFPTTAQVVAALDYVDAELPFFVDTPRILGVSSSVHCYHTVPVMGQLLFSGRTSGLRPRENQGYAVVTCEE